MGYCDIIYEDFDAFRISKIVNSRFTGFKYMPKHELLKVREIYVKEVCLPF